MSRLDTEAPYLVQVTYSEEGEERGYGTWWNTVTRSSDHLYVQPRQVSWLVTENGGADIDMEGQPVNPLDIVSYGYWAYHRLADSLPLDYDFEADER